jgi:hypothetical protein
MGRSTVLPGRVHFSHVSGHFVPGYFRLVPAGKDTCFRSRLGLFCAPPLGWNRRLLLSARKGS